MEPDILVLIGLIGFVIGCGILLIHCLIKLEEKLEEKPKNFKVISAPGGQNTESNQPPKLQQKQPDGTVNELAMVNKFPAIAQSVIKDSLQYKGYGQEAAGRFADTQKAKSIQKMKEVVKAEKDLLQETTELGKTFIDLKETEYKTKVQEREIQVKAGRMEQGEIEKQTKLELDITLLEKEKQKAQLEAEIQTIKTETEAKIKVRSDKSQTQPKEKVDQVKEIEKKIEQVRQKFISIQKAREEIKEIYKDDPDRQQEMLDRFDRELVEGGILKEG